MHKMMVEFRELTCCAWFVDEGGWCGHYTMWFDVGCRLHVLVTVWSALEELWPLVFPVM